MGSMVETVSSDGITDRHSIGSNVLQAFNPSSSRIPSGRLECHTLIMNSVTALMTPHNIMIPNGRLERKFMFPPPPPKHHTDSGGSLNRTVRSAASVASKKSPYSVLNRPTYLQCAGFRIGVGFV
jgi:hypothetical protein